MFYSKESIFQYLFLKAKIFFPAKKVMLHYGLTLFKVIISYVVSIFIIVYLFFCLSVLRKEPDENPCSGTGRVCQVPFSVSLSNTI